MKKITSNKLLNYGAMSAAMLGAANVSGQIVYTDIDDITITELATGIDVNLNGNDDVDFTLYLGNFTGGPGFVAYPGTRVDNGNGSTQSAFIGFDAGGFMYGSNLVDGDIIDATSTVTDGGIRADMNFYGCAFDNSQFCGDLVDAYVGFAFLFDGNTHYGWARIDVNVTGLSGSLTLKDFAFNSVAGEAIAAGQGALSLEDNTIEGFSSYVSNDVLTLNARIPMESLSIHSISGQELISRKLSNTSELIDLSALSTGVYVATVTIEGKSQAIKFVK